MIKLTLYLRESEEATESQEFEGFFNPDSICAVWDQGNGRTLIHGGFGPLVVKETAQQVKNLISEHNQAARQDYSNSLVEKALKDNDILS